MKTLVLFISCVSVICESAYVDSLGKCSTKDFKCHQNFIKKLIQDLSETEVPELGIPKLDPLVLKDVSVTVSDLFGVTLIEGEAKGIKKIDVLSSSVDFDKGQATFDIMCDSLTIKGLYKAYSSGKQIEELFGNAVHGEGKGKVKLEKVHLKFQFNFEVEKRDGDYYIKCDDKTRHEYELGKMTFAADNLYLGDVESSKVVVDLLNNNWKVMMDTFGKSFVDKAMSIIMEYLHKYFDNVSTKHFITEDLSQYAKA